MDTLMTPCIFCGHDRPLASEFCPHCGRGWIDSRVSDAVRSEPASNPEDRDEPAPAPAGPSLPEASAEETSAVGDDRADTGPEHEQPSEETPAAEAAPAFLTDAAATGWEAGATVVFEAATIEPPAETPAGPTTDAEEAARGAISGAPTAAPPAAPPAADPAPAPPTHAPPPASEAPPPTAAEPAAEVGEAPAHAGDEPDTFPEFPAAPAPTAPAPADAAPSPPETPEETPPGGRTPPSEIPDDVWPEPLDGDPGSLSVFPAITAAEPIPPRRSGDEHPVPPPSAGHDAPPEPPAVIDPDRLIDSVFDDSLFDEPDPRAASDDMLDDEDAWSAFAAGSLGAAPPAPAPPGPEASLPPAQEPPAPAAPGAETTAPVSVPLGPEATAPPAPGPEAVDRIYPSTMGEFRGEHPDESDFFSDGSAEAAARRGRWSQRVIVALIVAGIIGAWFVVIAWITQDNGDTTVTPTTIPDITSTAPTTEAPTTSAAPTTTSTTTATSTTTTTTTLPVFEASGDPIASDDLALQAGAMGVLEFGTTEGLGRLVATFGQPDARFAADSSWGICEEDIGFVVQWGPLSGIFIGSDDLSTFEGYRLVNAEPDHPASVLATLSGVRVGDTVADLEETYGERFTIVYEEIDGVPSFMLLSSEDATLLWGPLSSTNADGVVEGINSPTPCDGGPAPTS